MPAPAAALLALLLLGAAPRLATAACECGYSVNATTDESFQLYTELLENDFLHTTNVTGSGWQPQAYNVSAEAARGPYAKAFAIDNIVPNPLHSKFDWAGDALLGGDAGLQLRVPAAPDNGAIGGAEMTTFRTDMEQGSYRVAMKLAGQPGTCGAFFWFFNDSQEIDLEFLSKQFNDSQGALNLVVQTPQSVSAGFDAANTTDYRVQPLPFNPSTGFHEYRFDWSNDLIEFYVDGAWTWSMTHNLPSSPGHLFLNHWSNGDPSWSAGPPPQDTLLTVSYVKAYFNSSDPHRQADFAHRCPAFNASQACQIPDQTVAPDPAGANGNQTARTYFFSLDVGHAPNQTVSNSTTNHVSAAPPAALRTALWPALLALAAWAWTCF